MALFICPNCEEKSQMAKREDGTWKVVHSCPFCGHEFTVDQDLNVIVEE